MSKKFELLRPALTVGGWALSGHPTAAPRVSAARQKGTPDIGSGDGWKRVQRISLPSLHVTEFQHMLRSEIIQKRRSSASGPKESAKQSGFLAVRLGVAARAGRPCTSRFPRVWMGGGMRTVTSAVAKPLTAGEEASK